LKILLFLLKNENITFDSKTSLLKKKLIIIVLLLYNSYIIQMSQEIKNYASEISELLFDNTSKIPEGMYLEIMNKLKKVVDTANSDRVQIKFQNIDYKDRYLNEVGKFNNLGEGIIHTMFKPIYNSILEDPNDYIDLNNCLVVGGEKHVLSDVLSIPTYDSSYYTQLLKPIGSFTTNMFLRGKMLCLWKKYQTISTFDSDYFGNYFVNDIIHFQNTQNIQGFDPSHMYDAQYTPEKYNVKSDMYIKILKLNKKDMLVNVSYFFRVEKSQSVERFKHSLSKVKMEYTSFLGITKTIQKMVINEFSVEKFDSLINSDHQLEIKESFERINENTLYKKLKYDNNKDCLNKNKEYDNKKIYNNVYMFVCNSLVQPNYNIFSLT
jgi:hypothetical protein